MRELMVFEKEYEYDGSKFSVHVRYMGYIHTGRLAQQKHTWVYAILVNGRFFEQGIYSDLQGRVPANEDVCDVIASFWGDSTQIKEAQNLEGSRYYELDQIVQRCAKKMFEYFQEETFDYDIISKYSDDYGWEVRLMPNLATARDEGLHGRKQMIFSFKQFPQHDGQYMTVYELERSIYTKF